MPINLNDPALQVAREMYPEAARNGDMRPFEEWLPSVLETFPTDPRVQEIARALAAQLEAQPNLTAEDQRWAKLVGQVLPGEFEILDGQGQVLPLEQALLNVALPGLVSDLGADAGRRTLADNLAQQALGGANAAAQTLARTQGGGFDGRSYLERNPDVAQAFAGLNAGTTPETRQVPTPQGVQEMTPAQFAEYHYLQFGQREGRQPFYTTSSQLAQDLAAVDQTTQANIAASNQAFQTQLAGLQQANAAMQQNLTGALGERAAALQQQLASLEANLGQLDASQRAALTEQIAAQQANLEQAIGAQRQALQQQLASLGTAAGAEAAARRAALQQEIAGLEAAQAPLADARLRAAELQATAVNVGLERTRDQFAAEQARQGFVGGSTMQDAALARATVDARQRAAEAMSGARVQNASDTRDIGVRGATGERSIADALAGANREIASTGANREFDLASALAQGQRSLGDAQAVGLGDIARQTALSRAGIGAMGANQTFADQTFGADQKRSLADVLAQGQLGLTSTLANQTLGAQQEGNAARLSAYGGDFNRQLTSALGLAALPQALTQSLTGLDNYANSGLNRTLNTLNWWGTNQGQAPTPGFTPVQPGTSGNDIAGLGAGLVGLAGSMGQANNWWQAPGSRSGGVGVGSASASSPSGYLTPGGNVGVQTNWG